MMPRQAVLLWMICLSSIYGWSFAGLFAELFEWSGGFFPTLMQRLLIKCLLHDVDLTAFTPGPISSSPARRAAPSAHSTSHKGARLPHESGQDTIEGRREALSTAKETKNGTTCLQERRRTAESDGSPAAAPTAATAGDAGKAAREGPSLSDGNDWSAKETLSTALSRASCGCWNETGAEVSIRDAEARSHSELRAFVSVFRTAVERAQASAALKAGQPVISTLSRFAGKVHSLPHEELMLILLKLSRNVFSILSGESPGGSNLGSTCVCCLTNSVCGQGLYAPPVCYVNHRCNYNVRAVFGGSCRASLRLVSVRDIAPDEEICVCYVPRTECARERRTQLLRDYGFLCCCPLCCSCPGDCDARPSTFLGKETREEAAGFAVSGRAVLEDAANKNDGRVEVGETPTPAKSDKCSRNHRYKKVDGAVPLCQAFDAQLNDLFCSSPACRALTYSSEANALSALDDAGPGLGESLKARSAARTERRQPTRWGDGDEAEEIGRYLFSEDDAYEKGVRLRMPALRIHSEVGYCGVALSALKPGQMPLTCMRCEAVLTGDLQETLARAAATLPRLTIALLSSAILPESASLHRFFSAYQLVFSHTHPGNLRLLEIRARVLPVFLGEPALYVPWTLLLTQHQMHAAAAVHGAISPEAAEELEAAGRLLLFTGQGSEAEAQRAWWTWSSVSTTCPAEVSKEDYCTNALARMRVSVLRHSFECLRRAYRIRCLFYGGAAPRSRGVEELLCQCSRELTEHGETVPDFRFAS